MDDHCTKHLPIEPTTSRAGTNDGWSAIMSDELNPYASQFFGQVHSVEVNPFDAFEVADAEAGLIDTDEARYNPFIDVKFESALPAENNAFSERIQSAAMQLGGASPTLDFWQAPLQTPGLPRRKFSASEYRLPVEVETSEPAARATFSPENLLSFKVAAPVAAACMFISCMVYLACQLNTQSEGNCLQAQSQFKQGKYLPALFAANEAIKANPFAASGYFEKSRALTRLMRYREARECLDKSLAINPELATALDSRAALSLKTAQPEQTIADSLQLAKLLGGQLSAVQYGNLAVAYYKVGQFDRSIAAYDHALALDKSSATLALGRAYCLAGKQQHKAALAVCDNLIKRDGLSSKVLALRGYCYERQNDNDRALRDFNLALAKDPTNAAIYTFRAGLMEQLKKPQAALKDYLTAAKYDNDNAEAQYKAAKYLKSLGQEQTALIYYNRLAQFPSFERSFDQHQDRAALNYHAGHYQACLADLKRAIELEPDCDLHVLKSLCLARLGQAGEARATIAEASRLSPGSATVALADAQVEEILGQTLSAIDKYSLLLTANQDDEAALSGRGACYFSRGQWASAARDLKKAIAQGDNDSQVKVKLAHCQQVLASGARVCLDLPSRRVIDLTKLNRTQLFADGSKAYESGDNQLASIYFGELAKREPSNLVARTNLAFSYEGAGMHDEAIATFEQLSLAGQLDVRGQACYAHALASAGLYDRSIAIMQRLNDSEPKNVAFRLDLIRMFSAAGQIDKAIASCRDALAMNGSNAERSSLHNVYESLVTEKSRSKNEAGGSATTAVKPETEG